MFKLPAQTVSFQTVKSEYASFWIFSVAQTLEPVVSLVLLQSDKSSNKNYVFETRASMNYDVPVSFEEVLVHGMSCCAMTECKPGEQEILYNALY